MGIIKKMRKQKAVYWEPLGPDPFGNMTYATPVEIKCRWEGSVRRVMNKNGVEVVTMDCVYTDRDVKVDGVLWEGEIANLMSQFDPFANTNAANIITFKKVPNLKASDFLREARL